METNSSYLLTFLLNSLWQIPLFAVVAFAVTTIMRNGPAAHRHAVWVAALIASISVPIVSSVQRSRDIEPLPVVVPYAPSSADLTASKTSAQVSASASSPQTQRTLPFTNDVSRLLIGAYALFLLYRLSRLLWVWTRTRKLRRHADPAEISHTIESIWQRCLTAFKVDSPVLHISGSIQSPATVGNTVILPESMLAETSEDVLTAAVGHELAHIERRDYHRNLFYEVILCPIAFHPVAKWIARSIRETRELACDELVTRKVLNADAYARSILEIAAASVPTAQPDYSLGVFDGDILERRIRRLLERRVPNVRRSMAMLGTGLAGLALCGAIASTVAFVARAQSASYAELKAGEAAYNEGALEKAIGHFETASKMEPGNIKARLLLAKALVEAHWASTPRQGTSPYLTKAREQYEQILKEDPTHRSAMHGVMRVAMVQARPQEALQLAGKLIQADSSDSVALYTAGVAQWAIVFPEWRNAQTASGGRIDDYFIHDANLRRSLRDKYDGDVQQGIESLQQAMKLKADFDEAMAYLNLLYRLKASYADTPDDSKRLLAEADAWVGKAVTIMKAKKGTPTPQPKLDVDQPDTSVAASMALLPRAPAPPPPPPPPPPPAGNKK